MRTYDLIIIGSGGGTKLRPVADLGKKVAIIEKDALGGTCLNRGCIPSKMLIYPADLITHWKEDRAKFGITASDDITLDFTALISRTTAAVEKDSQDIETAYNNHSNIDYYHGQARFVGPKEIQVGEERLTADKIVLAVGARPHIPDIPGLVGTPFFTSTEALSNTTKPKSLLVIGGGYIAVELGHFYQAAGTAVTFLVRGEMVSLEDKDIREAFTKDFTKRHQIVRMNTIQQVTYADNHFTLTVEDKTGQIQTLTAEALLVATGVEPNSDTLGLENTAVKTTEKGFIDVNKYLETAEPGVYALGDVIGHYLFRHSANFEGEYLYRAQYKEESPQPISYPPMPHAIFSMPQIAGVGVTEDVLLQAGQKRDVEYAVGINHYTDSAMGMAMLPEVGMVKLIADKQSRKIIGAHIVGDKASDIIHMLIAYMTMEATIDDLLRTIYIHPALSENIRNATRKLVKELEKR